jgi:hypothetical protein
MSSSPPRRSADASDPVVRAAELAQLFCSPLHRFGGFRAAVAAEVPQPHRGLLDHSSHMTVAMERFHGGPVALRVVATADGTAADPTAYSREILLIGPAGTVVQHGIVRLDLRHVNDDVAAAIRAARVPLGRILIDAGLLRDVQRVQLLEVSPGPHLAALFAGAARPRPIETAQPVGRTFGRVAEISLDGRPAVELLEIVAPAAG